MYIYNTILISNMDLFFLTAFFLKLHYLSLFSKKFKT